MPRIYRVNRPWISKPLPKRDKEHDPFYDSPAWRKVRMIVLKNEPLCRECKTNGMVVEARVVDHIKQKIKYPDLALELSNLQPLCNRCHARKSGLEGQGHK